MITIILDLEACEDLKLCKCPMEKIGTNFFTRIQDSGVLYISNKNYYENKAEIDAALAACPIQAMKLYY